jgi:hypothetical protein
MESRITCRSFIKMFLELLKCRGVNQHFLACLKISLGGIAKDFFLDAVDREYYTMT